MLDYAATRQGFDGRIQWQQADALGLPFEDALFDVVCCQFGAMFFADRAAGYAEARRVLRLGGRFVFSVWNRIEENAFADAVTNAVIAGVSPHDLPRFLARTPHGYHDVALIREELRRSRFFDIDIEARDASLLQLVTDRAMQAITSRHGEGPVTGKIRAYTIAAA